MKNGKWLYISGSLALCLSSPALAAEDFQVRYNLAGSLGGEIFAPPVKSGWGGGIALTRVSVDKVTGGDGNPITQPIPGGVVSVPGAPSFAYPTYGKNTATLVSGGSLNIYNVAIGYLSTEFAPGERFAFLATVPYGRKDQRIDAVASTPALNYPAPAAYSPAQRSAIESQFGVGYQRQLGAAAGPQNGIVSGVGDVELQGGWLLERARWRVLTGVALVLPTGKYSSASGPDIGYGNFYTLRPSIQASYQATEKVGLAGKLSFGFNSRNRDSGVRSGNWASLEGAAAYMTPIGPIGLHAVYVDQFQDDKGNVFGPARFKTSNAGAFFTTKLPGADGAVTLQIMRTVSSRYAKAGSFAQVRAVFFF